MAGSSEVHPADRYAGQRVRARRWELGLTQADLAKRCGIKFQQIQKYETGVNRISVSRLDAIAKALKVSPSYFFTDKRSPPDFPSREVIELVGIYQRLPLEGRQLLGRLARAL